MSNLLVRRRGCGGDGVEGEPQQAIRRGGWFDGTSKIYTGYMGGHPSFPVIRGLLIDPDTDAPI
jgi:hypothetical protein